MRASRARGRGAPRMLSRPPAWCGACTAAARPARQRAPDPNTAPRAALLCRSWCAAGRSTARSARMGASASWRWTSAQARSRCGEHMVAHGGPSPDARPERRNPTAAPPQPRGSAAAAPPQRGAPPDPACPCAPPQLTNPAAGGGEAPKSFTFDQVGWLGDRGRNLLPLARFQWLTSTRASAGGGGMPQQPAGRERPAPRPPRPCCRAPAAAAARAYVA